MITLMNINNKLLNNLVLPAKLTTNTIITLNLLMEITNQHLDTILDMDIADHLHIKSKPLVCTSIIPIKDIQAKYMLTNHHSLRKLLLLIRKLTTTASYAVISIINVIHALIQQRNRLTAQLVLSASRKAELPSAVHARNGDQDVLNATLGINVRIVRVDIGLWAATASRVCGDLCV